MEFRIDKGTGYMYCYNPKHPTANGAGKVLEHVYVMYKHIGRTLEKGECVHHIDRDRTNNNIENLQLMTQSEHMTLHKREDAGFEEEDRSCGFCGVTFTTSKRSSQVFCSAHCCTLKSRSFEISREDLYDLVWKYPTVAVAKILGVSDVAVSKRCKRLSVPKPPRGYWNKLKNGKEVIDRPELEPITE